MPNRTAIRPRLLWLLGSAFQLALTAHALAQQESARGTPQAEAVVDREQLNQRNVQTLEQALAYTPEASVDVSGYDPLGDAVDIRGFPVTYTSVYRDGLRQTAVDLAIPRIEPYGAEAVTVLRTPAAGIFGSSAPGGIINVTTKRPAFDPSGEIELQAGTYGRAQGNFDIGGPVEGSDGRMAYRLTGLVRQSGTYLPGAPDGRTYLAPALTWKPDDDTTLTVLAGYLHTRLPSNPTYYRYPDYVVSRFYQGDPAFGALQQDQYRIGYAFEHRFAPDLIVRQNLRYDRISLDFPAVSDTGAIDPALRTAPRGAFLSDENLGAIAVDTQAEGHAETGPVAHTLIAGLVYDHYDFRRRYGSGPAPRLDLVTLDYGERFIARPVQDRLVRQSQDQVGVYLSDEMKWGNVVLTLAGRYDRLLAGTSSAIPVADPSNPLSLIPGFRRQTQDDTAFTYRVGLNYLLTPDVVPYASYATFFAPQPGSDPVGDPFDPSRGSQLEAGVKFAVPGANITGSISGFDITQSSNSIRDLTTFFFQLAVGSVEARGFEMETTANVAPGTSLTLAFRHLDFRFTQQTANGTTDDGRRVRNFSLDGNTPAGIPSDIFSAFATYLFPTASPLSGLTLGGGLRFTGPSFATDFNIVRNPTVTLFDALVAYDLAALDARYKGFRAQINGFNVFDRTYTNCQNLLCFRGAPATVIGSLVYRW